MEEKIESNGSLWKRECGLMRVSEAKRLSLDQAYKSPDFEPIQEITVYGTINHIDIDFSHKFAVTCDCEGTAAIYGFKDSRGKLELIAKHRFVPSTLHKCQWYPSDDGMISLTYSNKVILVDTASLRSIDSYDFGDKKIYGTDWNMNNPRLIAVGTSSSSIRFIDIRSGSNLQQITVESRIGSSNHNVSRVLWSPIDDECIFAGDSSGYIHVFDIRKPRKSLQTVVCEDTLCEPVVSLSFTCDSANLVSAHGLSNRLTQWTFRNKNLVNTNIHYAFPYVRPSKNKLAVSNIASSFLKCQLYLTETMVFKPIPQGVAGVKGEVCIYDLKNGERLRCLNPPVWNPENCLNVNCVTGFHHDYPIVVTGSKRFIRVWGLNPKDEKTVATNKLYDDDWSD
ncbi:uncharacterized protein LOC141857690 [Brevipalpus obovatus]|uniref:uncharacterized protein LOC141857690 n=1 Tax=Brevipalpus obovatus TaxID=246614 RepID=UPI003D9F482C